MLALMNCKFCMIGKYPTRQEVIILPEQLPFLIAPFSEKKSKQLINESSHIARIGIPRNLGIKNNGKCDTLICQLVP